jgi:hypothetical protein
MIRSKAIRSKAAREQDKTQPIPRLALDARLVD